MNSHYRKSLPGTDLDYFDVREAVETLRPDAYRRLPYTARVLAEQLVRRCEPERLDAKAPIDAAKLVESGILRRSRDGVRLLGKGELRCSLALLGKTEVWETAYTGVWWVRHLGADDRVSSETIEITWVPEILRAHPDDVAEAERRLAERIDQGPGVKHEQEPEEATHDP